MKWKKIGQIFNPIDYKLSNECMFFAQSPQTLVFKDFVRIYFSTRKKDFNGKYLSYISFIDYNIEKNEIINISSHNVIELGKLGTYDEHGIFPLNIFKEENNRIMGYIGGWNRRKSVSVETSIGISQSYDNGLTFNRLGNGPILTASINEPFLVGDPFVAKYNNIYYMWYIYGKEWIVANKNQEAERVYKIGYAISNDGINWEKQNRQIISDKIDITECQAMPTVIDYDKKYHMIFCYRHAFDFRTDKKKSYKLGYALSDDLKQWDRDDNMLNINFEENEWDSNMQCYPHLFHYKKEIYLLYNGNEFGKYGFGIAILEK